MKRGVFAAYSVHAWPKRAASSRSSNHTTARMPATVKATIQ
jgi:hypothetical protein